MHKVPTLNIPDTKDQFEACPYVEDMTPHQLKVLHKRVVLNLQALANALDDDRPDIAIVIDNILDGDSWTPKAIKSSNAYAIFGDVTIRFDLAHSKAQIRDKVTNALYQEMDTMSEDELDKKLNR